jgi:hypothetical protein
LVANDKKFSTVSPIFFTTIKKIEKCLKIFLPGIDKVFWTYIEYNQNGQMQIDLSKIITILGCNILLLFRGVHV